MATKPKPNPNLLRPPVEFPEDQPYWQAAREGRLLTKKCQACGDVHHFPRPRCPFCGSADTQWITASGKGTIYSFTIQRRAPRPTAPAIVEMAEGPRIITAIVDADVHALQIGDEVEVTWKPTDNGPPVPLFTTPAAQRARAYAAEAVAATAAAIDPAQVARVEAMRVAAVVGAGNMGVGITLCLLAAGFEVILIDQAEASLERAQQNIGKALSEGVARGRWSQHDADARAARVSPTTAFEKLAGADLVIEAVWEQLALKQQVFALIDRHAHPDALLGSNTSTLDVDLIAGATSRPERVIGLHFFSPAHVMRLLEIVRGPRTSAQSVDAARAIALRMKKVGVVVGICEGFVGNRLMIARERQAAKLILEGALPAQVDRVLTEFGLPMGTFELQDMAGGIEIGYRRRQESGDKNWLMDRFFELGRLGQKTGKGYYLYEPGKRTPIVDPEVTALIKEASSRAGITRRAIDDTELSDRLILPMINEGAKLIEEGVVERASDIDAVWLSGFGWPTWKGGPMHWANTQGAAHLLARLNDLQTRHGDVFKPAQLIERLAREGGSFVGPQ
jgi:3-hydroxyacyl-CoA dehydrogenase